VSTVLHRLIGRANGAASGGLRPRLPSPFEAGFQSGGFTEIHAETPAAPTPGDHPQIKPSPPPQHLASDRDETRVPPAALQPSVPDNPSRQPPSAALREKAPSGTMPTLRAEPPPAPAPLLPTEIRRGETALEVSPDLSELIGAADTVGPQSSDPGNRPHTVPEPLLPPDTSARLLQFLDAGPAPQPPDVRPDTQDTTTAHAQPAITIHIGRLDIRSEAPKTTAPPRRAAAPRSLPGLSDYLRGGQS
jgi:hypothetical protein